MGVYCARGAIPMPRSLLEADREGEDDVFVEAEHDGFVCKFDLFLSVCKYTCVYMTVHDCTMMV